MFKKKDNCNYFERFSRMTGYAREAAELLYETVRSFDATAFPAQKQRIHEIENSADQIKHDTMECLAHEFITPIEREDIVVLLQELDNVIDAVDDIMGHLYMFNVSTIKPEAVALSDLVLKSCTALEKVFSEFGNFRRSSTIGENIVKVNTLETEGDALHSNSIHKMFEQSDSTLDIIIWKDIFDCYEDCLDCCEHVADAVESVMMKNS